ncbi:MarR family winged helix-turn-helix transcriptional regulator [Priestia flexa]|uniref:MarR family winged helix-turn-helix transcriptional regulator n=1 Tax=Priestia flexa TaxID=86664 RepID=UPI001F4D16B6|nr:MarR family transcriptional regulator [Priestia flexa]
MEQADNIKKAISIFNKVNDYLMKTYFSSLINDITPKQFNVLRSVYDMQPVNVQTIAKKYNLSMSSVSQLITKLEKESYLHRELNPENRREILLTLGPKGQEYFDEYERIDQFVIERYYSHLSMEETQQLKEIANKLYRVVTGENSDK